MLSDNGCNYDSYRLRMSLGKWYLELAQGNVLTTMRIGPFSYNEAHSFAKDNGLTDIERNVKGDRP